MATRHNACTNPACKNNVTGWGGGSTPTQATGLTGFPDRTTGASYTSGTFLAGPTISVSVGQTWTISIYARSNAFNVNSGNIYTQWNNGSNSTTYTLTAGVVKRLSFTATAPSGATSLQIVLDGQNYGVSSGDFTEVLYEMVGSLDSYFDGDTPGATWDGADGNSASTLSSTINSSASDAFTTSDAVTSNVTLPRSTADAFTASDAVTRVVALVRPVADAFTTSDAQTRTSAHPRSTADAFTTSDAVTSQLTHATAANDAFTTSDAVTRVVALIRAMADSLTAADLPTAHATAARATSDAVNISDAATSRFGIKDVQFSYGPVDGAWQFHLLGGAGQLLVISSLSTPYITVAVAAQVNGASYDPTGDVVQMAFMPGTSKPGNSDWITGLWETRPGPIYVAKVLVGPASTAPLAVGAYSPWIKVVDNPEVPVVPLIDRLVVE